MLLVCSLMFLAAIFVFRNIIYSAYFFYLRAGLKALLQSIRGAAWVLLWALERCWEQRLE